MILGFKKYIQHIGPTSFKEKILAEEKIHSIRRDEKDRWRAGRKIHMAYGVRTKFYECFMESECVSVETILIGYLHDCLLYVKIGDKVLSQDEQEELALNDGFDSLQDFCNYFNHDFSGKIIHWTKKRYSK